LAPRGDALALAQRRGAEERIVWAELACAQGAAASGGAGARVRARRR
jgi:hypothetical protein